MAARESYGTRQRGTVVNKARGSEVVGPQCEDKDSEYDLHKKRVTQMEMVVDEHTKKWKDMDNELKEIKAFLRDLKGRETRGVEGSDQMFQRVEQMSSQIAELRQEIDSLRSTNDGVMGENRALKQRIDEMKVENGALLERLNIGEERGKEQTESLKKLKHEQEGWVKTHEENIVDFKEVMKQQEEDHKNNLEKQVIQVLKRKENVVRDMVEKKRSVIVFGLKEKVLTSKFERGKEELKLAREIIGEVGEENMDSEGEIEEVYRMGKYDEGRDRPMKIKLRSQAAATSILDRTWKLAQTEKYKKVWIREDLNEEERARRNELIKDAKEKNEQRSETEKNKFYWRVLDGKTKKWYIKRE